MIIKDKKKTIFMKQEEEDIDEDRESEWKINPHV